MLRNPDRNDLVRAQKVFVAQRARRASASAGAVAAGPASLGATLPFAPPKAADLLQLRCATSPKTAARLSAAAERRISASGSPSGRAGTPATA